MYREYKLVCKFEKKKILSEWMFRHIFNTQFNLSFHSLVVDSCKTCDALKSSSQSQTIKFEEKSALLLKKEDHLSIANSIHAKQKGDIRNCQESKAKTAVLTFDLQRALEMPSISTNEAYYRRQLWMFNLCIYDEVKKQGSMYTWNESIASRGG